MLTRSNVVLTCAAAFLAACAAPASKSDSTAAAAAGGSMAEPNVAEVRAAIESANKSAAAGMVAGDLKAALASYSDDAITMMPGMPMMSGRPAFEGGMKGMMDVMKVNAASFATTEVIVRGDMAVETGTFEMTTTMSGGKPMPDKGKYMALWKRQGDGTWKVYRDINNTDGPPPPAPK